MLTRRSFLRQSAAASLALAFPAIVRGRNLNSLVQVAVIGCDGQGLDDLSQIGTHPSVKFVGFCDVDTGRLAKADAKFPEVPHFQDFRAMFVDLGDKLDAVQVSTPDHMHAFISMGAMQRGKHVYCQKPLTQTVWEARQMRRQAEKSKVITQMGNQIHSATEYRTGVRAIRSGIIGKIKAVHSWQGNKGNQHTGLTARPEPAMVPPTLNWDLWIGTAPMRPYAENAYAPFKWRDWQDFGGGALGDFGCHILDPVFCALNLTAPLSIRAENSGTNPEVWPTAETVSFIFPGTAHTTGKTIPVTWYDGGRQPDPALARMPEDKKLPGGGSLFIGEGGTLVLPHYAMPRLYPADKFAAKEIPKVAGLNHYHRWIDGILSGKKTSDGFHVGGPLTETVQLGNLATRLPGQTLEWDAPKLRFRNAPDADKLLTRPYRDGWSIKAVA